MAPSRSAHDPDMRSVMFQRVDPIVVRMKLRPLNLGGTRSARREGWYSDGSRSRRLARASASPTTLPRANPSVSVRAASLPTQSSHFLKETPWGRGGWRNGARSMPSAFHCCLYAARFLRRCAELRAPMALTSKPTFRLSGWGSLGFSTVAFGMAIVFSGSGQAASPQYCRLYSREFVKIDLNDMTERDRAAMTADEIELRYNKYNSYCLDQTDEPALPTTIIESDSYWVSSTLKITNSCPPVPKLVSLAPKPTPIKNVDDTKKPPLPNFPQKLVCSRDVYSGFALGSKEQIEWCKQNYRTYNPKTGYVWCSNMKRDRCS